MKDKTLYRYEIQYSNSDGPTDMRLKEYPVVRETGCFYFINPHHCPHKEKRISKRARNTYAYNTKEKAKEHFTRRTIERVRWYYYWTEECEKGLKIIETRSHPEVWTD